VFVSTILQVNAQNGQVYVYLTSNYAGDSSLQNVLFLYLSISLSLYLFIFLSIYG
jgi:hypothetical protein